MEALIVIGVALVGVAIYGGLLAFLIHTVENEK